MKKRILTAVAVLTILALGPIGASATNGNLVVNGDFEIPVVTASQGWDIYDSGYTGLGWAVEWRSDVPALWSGWTRPDPAHLELHRGVAGWQPYDGSQHAELDTDWDGPVVASLHGEPSSVTIYQNLATCPGETYTLQYAWSPRPNQGDNALEVWWDGAKIDTHSGANTTNQTSWTLETHSALIASSNTTRLAFVEVGTNNAVGMFLDAVSVVGPTVCEPPPGTGTPGYWKNHPDAWPVDTITIGGVTYTRDEAIAIMKTPVKGDKTLTMFPALVAAKLNVLVGNDDSCIADTITAADAWMAIYGPVGSDVKASSDAWKEGGPLHEDLDRYNNGKLCAPHRG